MHSVLSEPIPVCAAADIDGLIISSCDVHGPSYFVLDVLIYAFWVDVYLYCYVELIGIVNWGEIYNIW